MADASLIGDAFEQGQTSFAEGRVTLVNADRHRADQIALGKKGQEHDGIGQQRLGR